MIHLEFPANAPQRRASGSSFGSAAGRSSATSPMPPTPSAAESFRWNPYSFSSSVVHASAGSTPPTPTNASPSNASFALACCEVASSAASDAADDAVSPMVAVVAAIDRLHQSERHTGLVSPQRFALVSAHLDALTVCPAGRFAIGAVYDCGNAEQRAGIAAFVVAHAVDLATNAHGTASSSASSRGATSVP